MMCVLAGVNGGGSESAVNICTSYNNEKSTQLTLLSPGFPHSYPPNMECRCIITAQRHSKVSVAVIRLSTLWSIKNQTLLFFFDNCGKYWRIFVIFFTAVFSKERQNKNLLKFLPHLKSVATLPCETWNGRWWVAHATDLSDLSCPVRRCAVLLEYEIITWYFLGAWQQLLLQQYFMIIVAVHFHSRLHNFIFQQDSAPAHRVCDTVALLCWETPDFISAD